MSITGFEIFSVNKQTLVTQQMLSISGGYLAEFIANMA
jgi:hypothetical protein